MPGTFEELDAELKRNARSKYGDIVTCRACGDEYKVPAWHFYGLCDTCCDEFKWQEHGLRRYDDGRYFFSCDEWIKFKKGGW